MSLAVEPCNLKALYSLQVAHGQDGNAAGMTRAHFQLHAVYAHLNFPNRPIVLGKSRLLLDQPQLRRNDAPSTLPTHEFEPTSFPAFHQPQLPGHRARQILAVETTLLPSHRTASTADKEDVKMRPNSPPNSPA